MKFLNFCLLFALSVCLVIFFHAKLVFSLLLNTTVPLMILAAFLLNLAAEPVWSVISALSTSLSGKEKDLSELIAEHKSLQRFENLLILCGVVTSMGANVACLANIGVPEMIGPCLSMSLTSTLFSLFVAKMLVFPLRMRLKKLINKVPGSEEESVAGGLALAGIPVASYLTMVIILYTV